jgi:signal transduction histidine kinase
VGVLREELARLNRLLNTVLNSGAPLSKDTRNFDLVVLVQEIETLLKPQAKRQKIDMQVKLPQQFLPVNGKRDNIKQALLNVAINALEAMPEGGVLVLSVGQRDECIDIVITDTGTGVPEDLLDEIYQVYFTTKKSGTGMGLYVARLVLEAHGGEIHVENRQEGNGQSGACFVLSLPRAPGK